MKRLAFAVLMTLLASSSFAQYEGSYASGSYSSLYFRSSDPSGTCPARAFVYQTTTKILWACDSGTWRSTLQSISSVFTIPDGTLLAPGLKFTNDTDAGFSKVGTLKYFADLGTTAASYFALDANGVTDGALMGYEDVGGTAIVAVGPNKVRHLLGTGASGAEWNTFQTSTYTLKAVNGGDSVITIGGTNPIPTLVTTIGDGTNSGVFALSADENQALITDGVTTSYWVLNLSGYDLYTANATNSIQTVYTLATPTVSTTVTGAGPVSNVMTIATSGTTFSQPLLGTYGSQVAPGYSFSSRIGAGMWAASGLLAIGDYTSATNKQYCQFWAGDVILCKTQIDANNDARLQLNPAGSDYDITGTFSSTYVYTVKGSFGDKATSLTAADGTHTVRVEANHDTGVRVSTSGAKPSCDATSRGSFWYVPGAGGVADTFEVCLKNAADAYNWSVVATP